jgi:hypothetical protein
MPPRAHGRAEVSEDTIATFAKRAGPLETAAFRVVTVEENTSVRTKDFTDFALAVEYADDAASEPDVAAAIFNAEWARVHTGRGYFYGDSEDDPL